MIADVTTCSDLHLNVPLAALASHCVTEGGREEARLLQPAGTEAEHSLRKNLIAESRGYLHRGSAPTFGSIFDIARIARRAKERRLLEPEELRRIGDLCHGLTALAAHLGRGIEDGPLLSAQALAIPFLGDIVEMVDGSFDPQGEVRPDATPNLELLTTQSTSLHMRLRSRVEEMVHLPEYKNVLQDNYFTQRNERYVLPVKSGQLGELKGIVHGRSATEQTIYVEPEALVPLNNDLKLLEAEIEQEIRLILRRLSDAVFDRIVDIEKGLEQSAFLDLIFAAGKLAEKFHLNQVETVDAATALFLDEARNPVLLFQGIDTIPNNIEYPEGSRWLIISGANAGGKSVTLNTLGTIAIMHAMGLPLPVSAKSRVPIYTNIRTVFGDAQDIESALSTFSGHIRRLADALEQSSPGALLLVDEIMDGTDPDQAAALAQAVLEFADERGLVGAVTTHFPRLKLLSDESPAFANARVLLDPHSQSPTYQLEIGKPAPSHPMAIARKAGLPDLILKRAEALMGPDFHAMSALKEKLLLEMHEVRSIKQEAEALETGNRATREQIREEKANQQRNVLKTLRGAADRTLAEIDRALKETRSIVRELQKNPSSQNADKARKVLTRLDTTVRELMEDESAVPDKSGEDRPSYTFEAGDLVEATRLGKQGTILSIRGTTAEVQLGVARMQLPTAELAPAKAKEKRKARRADKEIAGQAAPPLTAQIDLRGMRVDEALSVLEKKLDDLLLTDYREVTIVHGHGTSALKRAVREYLKTSPYAAKHGPEADDLGGDGATHLWLATS